MSAKSFTLKIGKYGNVEVTESGSSDSILVIKLHGHTIAVINTAQHWIVLDSCGFKTPTTKRALNRALTLLKLDFCVFQAKGVWWVANKQYKSKLTDMELFYDGMRLDASFNSPELVSLYDNEERNNVK